jgi:putative phosphoserine phosphatase / 1-acylglycerol-3-phosphate O-acyltransferase
VDEVAAIAEKIADELMDEVLPFVRPLIKSHHDAGRTVVLTTASNLATIEALANRLEFDHVIATKWAVEGDAYTGAIDGVRLHAGEKKAAVLAWAEANDVDLAESYAYSDSRSDAALLASVGHPVAVNPDAGLLAIATLRRWPVRFLDKPEGVFKLAGREMQGWARSLPVNERLDPIATIRIEGIENIPATGVAILVFNHRSYYDSTAVAYVMAKSGRDARSSTSRCSARSPRPWAASVSTAAPARTSRSRRQPRRCAAATSSAWRPRARSPAARRSSTRS